MLLTFEVGSRTKLVRSRPSQWTTLASVIGLTLQMPLNANVTGMISMQASHHMSVTADSLLDERADRLLRVCTAPPRSMRRGVRVTTPPALAALTQPARVQMRAGHIRAYASIQSQKPASLLISVPFDLASACNGKALLACSAGKDAGG